jgi:hypothetical protein
MHGEGFTEQAIDLVESNIAYPKLRLTGLRRLAVMPYLLDSRLVPQL